MTNDVRQWLSEIKQLQQRLDESRKERDEAFASAANWRNLYETEAQQRRTETNLHRQKVEALNNELDQFRQNTPSSAVSETRLAPLQERVNRLQGVEELRQELLRVLLECDRLQKILQAERENHAQTRQELTTALGDAMDLLTKTPGKPTNGNTNPTGEFVTKTPSPALPPVAPVESPLSPGSHSG